MQVSLFKQFFVLRDFLFGIVERKEERNRWGQEIAKDSHISVFGVVLVREIGQSTDPCARYESNQDILTTNIDKENYTVVVNQPVGIKL